MSMLSILVFVPILIISLAPLVVGLVLMLSGRDKPAVKKAGKICLIIGGAMLALLVFLFVMIFLFVRR